MSTQDTLQCFAHREGSLRYLGLDAAGLHLFECEFCGPGALLRWRSPGMAGLDSGVFDQSVEHTGDDGADGLTHTAEGAASEVPNSSTDSPESSPKGE